MYISLECIHFARKTDALKLGIIPNDRSNFQKETIDTFVKQQKCFNSLFPRYRYSARNLIVSEKKVSHTNYSFLSLTRYLSVDYKSTQHIKANETSPYRLFINKQQNSVYQKQQ